MSVGTLLCQPHEAAQAATGEQSRSPARHQAQHPTSASCCPKTPTETRAKEARQTGQGGCQDSKGPGQDRPGPRSRRGRQGTAPLTLSDWLEERMRLRRAPGLQTAYLTSWPCTARPVKTTLLYMRIRDRACTGGTEPQRSRIASLLPRLLCIEVNLLLHHTQQGSSETGNGAPARGPAPKWVRFHPIREPMLHSRRGQHIVDRAAQTIVYGPASSDGDLEWHAMRYPV